LRKLEDQWNQRAERPKNYGQKKNWSAVGAEQILERVSEHFQSDLERLKERSIRNNLARRCAITLCWDHAGLSHDENAALFRMPSSNSVAQTIRRTKTHDVQNSEGFKASNKSPSCGQSWNFVSCPLQPTTVGQRV